MKIFETNKTIFALFCAYPVTDRLFKWIYIFLSLSMLILIICCFKWSLDFFLLNIENDLGNSLTAGLQIFGLIGMHTESFLLFASRKILLI